MSKTSAVLIQITATTMAVAFTLTAVSPFAVAFTWACAGVCATFLFLTITE